MVGGEEGAAEGAAVETLVGPQVGLTVVGGEEAATEGDQPPDCLKSYRCS